MEDWLGITKIENDAVGRAEKVTYPDGREVSYTYGKAGERTSITYPDGKTIRYGFDGNLRLSELKDGDRIISYAYDKAGRLAEKNFPNGMRSSYRYDWKGQITELRHEDKEGVLDRYLYQYDLLGNKTGIIKERRGLQEESGAYSYGYDAIGRLESVAKDGNPLRRYGYDAFGNRTALAEKGQETAYAYNALNQLISKKDSLGETSYRYDRRGNLIQTARNGDIQNQYTYGALNRLERAVNGKGETARYQYNGLGYRVGKTEGRLQPETLKQMEENLNPLNQLKAMKPAPEKTIRYTIDLTREYHNLLEKEENQRSQVYLWDGNAAGFYNEGAENPQYYLQDELGSPLRIEGEDGSLRESYGYDEFGCDLYQNQGKVQPFGYTGYQHDRVAGTYFAQAREYEPEKGKFSGRDIVKGFVEYPLTFNEYMYCLDTPLSFIDYDGLEPVTAAEGLEAHKLLQADLALTVPGVSTEFVIEGSSAKGGAGRVDIVYVKNGIAEIYEIKPGSYSPGAVNNLAGKLQLERYISKYPGKAVKGTSLNPIITSKLYPSVMRKDKMIKYYTYPSDPGMIYWGYVNKPQTILEPEKNPVAIPEKENLEVVGEVALGALAIWGIYEIMKWGLAAAMVPATGGTSLAGAACLP